MRDPVEWNFASAPLAISLRRTSFGGPRIQTLMTFNQAVNDVKVCSILRSERREERGGEKRRK